MKRVKLLRIFSMLISPKHQVISWQCVIRTQEEDLLIILYLHPALRYSRNISRANPQGCSLLLWIYSRADLDKGSCTSVHTYTQVVRCGVLNRADRRAISPLLLNCSQILIDRNPVSLTTSVQSDSVTI